MSNNGSQRDRENIYEDCMTMERYFRQNDINLYRPIQLYYKITKQVEVRQSLLNELNINSKLHNNSRRTILTGQVHVDWLLFFGSRSSFSLHLAHAAQCRWHKFVEMFGTGCSERLVWSSHHGRRKLLLLFDAGWCESSASYRVFQVVAVLFSV